MKNLLIAGAVLMSVAGQSCLAAPSQKSSPSLKGPFAKEKVTEKDSVTEIKLQNKTQTIILQSDGSAIRYDVGFLESWKNIDPKTANYQQGIVALGDFANLVKLLDQVRFFSLKDINRDTFFSFGSVTSVIKKGKIHRVVKKSFEGTFFTEAVGEGDRLGLWAIEGAIYGVNSSIKWEKDVFRVRGVAHIKGKSDKHQTIWVVARSAKDAAFERTASLHADGTFQLLLPVGDYKLIARYYDASRSQAVRSEEQLVSVKDEAIPRLSFLIDQIKPTIK